MLALPPAMPAASGQRELPIKSLYGIMDTLQAGDDFLQGPMNRDHVPVRYQGGEYRCFTTTPPWNGVTKMHPYHGNRLARTALVFPRPAVRGRYLAVAVVPRDRNPVAPSAELLTLQGALLGFHRGGSNDYYKPQSYFRLPATFPDSAIVVRLVVPPCDTLYALIPVR
jgi:hypothetical protein